jgi:tRNA 2-selenouridine synthase
MVNPVDIDTFWAAPGPILDVRSPGEYDHGHLPGAVSFPLFSNDERAQVGICYKQQGRDPAVQLGFDLVGPKLGGFIRQAQALTPERTVRVHCWRGGMRSEAVAWALNLAGFQVTTLRGGYKTYRRWVRDCLAQPRLVVVLGGMTGTAKTDILLAMAAQGQQVIDLEGLAHHRGSSYGSLDMPPQPSTEQFENLLAQQWAALPPGVPVWLEAESRRIGSCHIPDQVFQQMEAAVTVEITRSVDERIAVLVDMYGDSDPEAAIAATERIRKRLGGQRTQAAIEHIRAGDRPAACKILLDYYDRAYRYDLERRQKEIPQVDVTGCDPATAAQRLQAKLPELQTPRTMGGLKK